MGTDRPPLVIRFGRLGDLVLCWPALAHLAEHHGPVEIVTSHRYAPWLSELPWIGHVWPFQTAESDLSRVMDLASRIRERGHGPVIDLHASLRSRVLCMALGGAERRVDKGSLDRRLRVGLRSGKERLRVGGGEVRSFPRRFLDAIGAADDVAEVPRLPREILGDPAALAAPVAPRLALLPGARRATKRWPADRYGELALRWQGETGGDARVFFGPGEEALAEDVVEASAGAASAADDLDLWAVTRGMARCAVAVGGDTGLLHLAAAAGARPLGLFGPTGIHMGYWPWHGRGAAIAPDLDCHPCTLYGSETCPLEHHACLAELEVERVLRSARELAEGVR